MVASAQSWWLFAGKLHPLVVHFPIALLLVAAALELFRLRRGDPRPGRAALICLCIGAPTAVLAAVLGWSDAATSGHQGTDAWVLATHRWFGIGAAAIAIMTLVGAIPAAMVPRARALAWYRFGLVTAAILVGITGHFGASLIYGTQYLPESFAKARGSVPPPTALVGHATVDFTRDIQPIFARRCYQCHAGDKVESDLHLDSREGALKGGKSGHPAIIPGNAAASEIVKLVKGQDPKRLMPPKNGTLETQQIELLETWIAQGAKWPQGAAGESWHWAYRPPVRSNPPQVKDTYWARNTIDHFVLALLEAENLKPSAEADKETLIRRVTLDLTGLPPTPAEIDAFLADTSGAAYESLVDRLLATPAYGERMAMKWLDLARYADTHGYEKDDRRTMWPYRDWVIDAFNRDLPFDQFTIEQLAGDMLPTPTTDQLIATGFNRNTQINEEGGVDPEEFRVDAVIDRVNTMGVVWLGSTVGCAQCHNHKNDPISQEEYYRLFAYFNNDDSDVTPSTYGAAAAGGMLPISKREDRDEYERIKFEVADLNKKLAEFPESELAAAQEEWEREHNKGQPTWSVLTATKVESEGGSTFARQEDGSYVASGNSTDKDTYTFEAPVGLAAATALRLEVMPDPSTPSQGVGRSSHANIVLQDFRVDVSYGREFSPVVVPQARADFEQGNTFGAGGVWPIASAIDGDEATGWAIGPKTKDPHSAIFRFGAPLGGGEGSSGSAAVLRVTMRQNYGGFHTIGRFRLSATNDPDPLARSLAPPDIAEILATPRNVRSAQQAKHLAEYFRSVARVLRPIKDKLEAAKKRFAEMTIARAMIMKRNGSPRQTHIFERGSFLSPAAAVEPGLPRVLKVSTPPQDRLELARWLVAGGNPLTARVTANRIWEQHFGRGLVETSDDFGTQGEYPTHPELLDWLATELPRQGWSLKALHRLIVTSATYRQASAVSPELLERDPTNKLLARAPRLRVEAETLRDVALAASGLLSTKIGGPSVFPPQPDGVWTMIYSNDKWAESKGEDRYRRGMYTFARRTAPYPTFATFDAPSREVVCTRRPRTTTPLQALATMNDPQFVEAAGALGARALREGGATDAQRLDFAFRLCTGRHPSAAEHSRLSELLAAERASYSANAAAAQAMLKTMPGVKADGQDPADLAAWAVVGNVLFNLDEAITRP